jgi:hypothetical protein
VPRVPSPDLQQAPRPPTQRAYDPRFESTEAHGTNPTRDACIGTAPERQSPCLRPDVTTRGPETRIMDSASSCGESGGAGAGAGVASSSRLGPAQGLSLSTVHEKSMGSPPSHRASAPSIGSERAWASWRGGIRGRCCCLLDGFGGLSRLGFVRLLAACCPRDWNSNC